MLEHSIFFCMLFLFYLFVLSKCYLKKVLEKKTEKKLEKKEEKGGSPPCRPGGPASAWPSALSAQWPGPRAQRSLPLLSARGHTGAACQRFHLLPLFVTKPNTAGSQSNPISLDYLPNALAEPLHNP